MNWRLQYVIAFITISTQLEGEEAVWAHKLLREEYGVSREEWVGFSRMVIQEGKIVTARIEEIIAQVNKRSQDQEVM
tara:strand:- start:396 stop:626 length:231 start_codon:yes stop_codon:yes gene_type:complete